MPSPNKHTQAITAAAERLTREMAGREAGAAERIGQVVDAYFLQIASLVAQQPTYAEILVGVRAAHLAMAETLRKQFGVELDKLADVAATRAVNSVLNALPASALDDLIQTVRPVPDGIDKRAAAKALVFRPDEVNVGKVTAQLIADTTHLGDPEKIASTINRIRQNGGTARQVMKEIRPMVQGVKSTVDRVTRDSGQLATTLQNLETWTKLGDMVIGYTVHAVPRSEFSRLDHLARNGTEYFVNPQPGQLSTAAMPRPPYDVEDGSLVLKHNCRCYLSPIFRPDL